jgi:hypothetical protein
MTLKSTAYAGQSFWTEYDRAAEDCARRGDRTGASLPAWLSKGAKRLINADPDAFSERVRATAYALAMAGTPEE